MDRAEAPRLIRTITTIIAIRFIRLYLLFVHIFCTAKVQKLFDTAAKMFIIDGLCLYF